MFTMCLQFLVFAIFCVQCFWLMAFAFLSCDLNFLFLPVTDLLKTMVHLVACIYLGLTVCAGTF